MDLKIKILLCISMFIEHLGFILGNDQLGILSLEMTYLWRLPRYTFPYLALCLADNFDRTSSRIGYLSRMLKFAMIVQVPYMLVIHPYMQLSSISTFALSLILLYLGIVCKNYILMAVLGMLLILFSPFIEYGVCGVLLPVILYYRQNSEFEIEEKSAILLIFSIITYGIDIGYIFVSMMSIPLYLTGRKYQMDYKWRKLFYWFYPLHFIVLFVIKVLVKGVL